MTLEAALAVLALAVLGQGKGDGAPELSLDIDPCVPVSADKVMKQTALELDVRVVPPAEARAQATRVQVSCTGEHLTLRVADPLTGKHLERTLALTTAELDVAGRTVAIAVSELVLTSWMELTLKQQPPPVAEFPPPSPEARSVARERAEQQVDPGAGVSYVAGAVSLVGPYRGVGPSFGAGAHLGWRSRSPWLGAELGLDGSWAKASLSTGTIAVSTWSLALRAAFRLGSETLWFDTGPGGRIGIARLQGNPYDESEMRGNTFAGTFGGPFAYAGCGAIFGGAVVMAGVEVGYILREAAGLADDERGVAIGGTWVGGSLGLGFAP